MSDHPLVYSFNAEVVLESVLKNARILQRAVKKIKSGNRAAVYEALRAARGASAAMEGFERRTVGVVPQT